MTPRRAAFGLAILVLAGALALPALEGSAQDPGPTRGKAVIVTVDGVPFELLARAIGARPSRQAVLSGGRWGLALMSARTADGQGGLGAYVTLGAGARAHGPTGEGDIVEDGRAVFSDAAALARSNDDVAVPGLLGSVLTEAGLSSCVARYENISRLRSVLVAMDRLGSAGVSQVTPGNCSLIAIDIDVARVGTGRPPERRFTLQRLVEDLFDLAAGDRALFVMLSPGPSPRMVREKDELTPILMARAGPDGNDGSVGTLASDTTRRVGLVSNEDVAPTVLDFFGIPVPSEMNGAPIRLVDASPPFEMHRKHLANRRMTVPVQVGTWAGVAVVGAILILAVARRDRLRPGLAGLAPAVPLAVPALGVALMAAGLLPELAYVSVVPFVVLVPLLVGLAVWVFLRRRGLLVPPAAVGAAVIAYLVVDALLGWPDTTFTFVGGTALDGARFYGLPNVALGLLLGSGLFVAAVLHPWNGFVVLVGLGLFAGFPDLGADIGGSIALFAAAGLWWGLAGRGRLGWREVGVVVLTVAAGLAVVLAANAWLAERPTHGTRFVEEADGVAGVIGTLVDRLGVGLRLIARSPFAALPALGLPVVLWLALRPPGAIRESLVRWPRWRWVVVVMTLAGMVAYVANDTGPSAAGFGFGLGLAALLYLPLAERAVPERTSPDPPTVST